MQQRGRRSVASVLALNVVDASSARLTPPASMSDAERKIFAATVAASDHLRASDMPLLVRYAEIVALSDHAAERLRDDVMQGRPSSWLGVQERLTRLLVMLARSLRLTPQSRTDAKTVARHDDRPVSAYELMAMESDHDTP